MNAATTRFEAALLGNGLRSSVNAGAASPSESRSTAMVQAHSLCAFLLEHATVLLDWALHAELEAFLARCAAIKDALGRPAVVRNGYQPPRRLQTNLGPVTIRIPKVRSRSECPAVFHSGLARPYQRHTRAMIQQAPTQFLRGLGSGDLHTAIVALMGPEAAALPVSAMQRLSSRWETEHKAWLTGPLSQLRSIALWVESLRCDDECPEAIESTLIAIGVDTGARERILAISHDAHESVGAWSGLLWGLRHRGLPPPVRLRLGHGVSQVIHEAVLMVYPDTPVVVPEASR